MSEVINIESRWFKIVVLIGSATISGISFANIIYYSKLRKNPGALSKKQATTMMTMNIIIFVVAIILLIWSVWVLLFSKEVRLKQTTYISKNVGVAAEAAKGYLTTEGTIIPQKIETPPIVKTPKVTVTSI